MNNIIEPLCHCELFHNIDKKNAENTLSNIEYQIKNYRKNELICRENQFSVNIGIIITGCVEMQKTLESGDVICMFHKNKGDIFGGEVAFSNQSVYLCNVLAREKSKILFLHKQSIFELLCNNSLIAANLLNSFSNRILYYEKRIELFSYSSIQKKIAFFLLDEMKIANNNIVSLPFSKKSWAEYLNVSRPSLHRELKKLSYNNIIKINSKEIIILDKENLTRLLQ